MEKIFSSDTNIKAICLSEVARYEPSFESGNHKKHIDIIFNSDSDWKAKSYARAILNSENCDKLDRIMLNAALFVDDQPDKNIELPDSVFKLISKE